MTGFLLVSTLSSTINNMARVTRVEDSSMSEHRGKDKFIILSNSFKDSITILNNRIKDSLRKVRLFKGKSKTSLNSNFKDNTIPNNLIKDSLQMVKIFKEKYQTSL